MNTNTNLNFSIALATLKDNTNGLSIITPSKTWIYVEKQDKPYFAEILLHELNELAIYRAIKANSLKADEFKAIENVSHFLNAYSLNQYESLVFPLKPFSQYIESDITAQI